MLLRRLFLRVVDDFDHDVGCALQHSSVVFGVAVHSHGFWLSHVVVGRYLRAGLRAKRF